MATVLFAPETFNLAETTRGIEIARHLRERFECVFMGYSERYAGHVREAGLAYHALAPQLTEAQAEQLIRVDQGRGLRHPFTTAMIRRRIAAERALIGRLRPRAVVIGTTLSMLVSARAEGVPLVYAKPFAYTGAHLAGADRLPVAGGDGRVADWVNRRAAGLARLAAGRVTYVPRSFRTAATENAVPLPRRTIDLLDADLNLITSPWAADYALPASYRTVGPIFARLDRPVPDVVRRLAERAEPLLYLAVGSSGNRRLVLALARALGRLPVNVVAPVAWYLRPGDSRLIPPNVHVTDLLPADRLGPFIDGSVIHGGEGTVQTACASGHPFVGIGLQLEQRMNIDACVRSGNALRVTRRDVGGARFARAVQRVIHDDALAERARAVQELVRGADGSRLAAEEVVALVSR